MFPLFAEVKGGGLARVGQVVLDWPEQAKVE